MFPKRPHRALRFLAFLAASCVLPAADLPVVATAPEDPLVASVVESSNVFAAELYGALRTEPGNLALAPLGLVQALLPVAAGVQGGTRDEMSAALHLARPIPDAADGLLTLTHRLERAAGKESNLTFARALWVQQWNLINDEYVELLRHRCRSELRVIDFARPEQAAHWMNRWIGDRTEDRITAVADATSYATNSCIVVANGVFLRTAWQRDFDPTLTESAPFFLTAEPPAASAAAPTPVAPGGEKVGTPLAPAGDPAPAAASVTPPPAPRSIEVPTMRRAGLLRTVAQPGFRLLELPYRNEQLAFVVLLPEAEVPLVSVEQQLTAAKITECLRAVREAAPSRIELRLPRFRTERATPRLTAALECLGLKTVFDRSGVADFTVFGGNPDGEPVYLSAVSHLVKFAVDEKGAAAGAASGTVAEAPYDAPVELPTPFVVNRPFLFFVYDHQSGAVLLMGRIVDPRAG